MSAGGRPYRAVLLAALTLSAGGPFIILALWSVGRGWFFPSVLPPAIAGDAWAAVFGHGAGVAAPLARAITTSITLGVATGVVATAVALPIGRALARLERRTRTAGLALAFLPVAIPPVALATGLAYALVRAGLGGRWIGVLLGHLVPTLGILAVYFLGIFTAFDVGLEDAARSLGARPAQIWTRVTLPVLRRPIAGACALGFLISWGQVPLTLLIGGGLVHALPLEVFQYVRSGDDRFAAVGALLLTVPPVLALVATQLVARRRAP